MTLRVGLHHETSYQYDRPVHLGPQLVRLRPAPHCRTPVVAYSCRVFPEKHFINWQQDPYGNYLARLVFPERVSSFRVIVELQAEMTVISPFDFFLEESAANYPFAYESELAHDLRPYLRHDQSGAPLVEYLAGIDVRARRTIDFLVDVNRQLQHDIRYLIRMEPGVQTCDETLQLRSGSCRDSAWLLVQVLRRLGLAARFVSGYLIQLKPDVPSLDGPSGTSHDFTDLHAWAEVYLPGAGWVGLDPTSGLLTGEGHLPVACTPDPQSAAPVAGLVDDCETQFHFK
ncbi:MAG: transglutaminase family protein, partial [Planctomycetales bacterium]|nr:transglutaminase family protein [Planctomycetales bacterium]